MSDVFETMKQAIKNLIKEEVERQVNERLANWEQKMEQAFSSSMPTTQPKEGEESLENGGDTTKGVSSESQVLYQFLRKWREQYEKDDPLATPSYKVIREKTDLTSNKVSEAYNELEAQNIISRKQKGRAKVVEFAPVS